MLTAQYIPLPEVNDSSDVLHIGRLGLPVGFDQERLLINVGAIEKAIAWGGLSHLVIDANEGQKRSVSITAHSDAGGRLMATGSGSLRKARLQSSTTEQNQLPGYHDSLDKIHYDKTSAHIVINTSEKDQRILDKQKKWPRGPHEVDAQATVLNMTIQEGLKSAITSSHFNRPKAITTTMMCGASGFMRHAEQSATSAEFAEAIAVTFIGMNAVMAAYGRIIDKYHLPDRQWSVFVGVPFDRHVVARMHAGRTLVKALA